MLSDKFTFSILAKFPFVSEPNFIIFNFPRSGHSLFIYSMNRGKSGHHRTGFPMKMGGACFKASSRQVQQKVNRLLREVRVKWWGKSSPSQRQPSELCKPNPMQDEIGNRVVRLWFRVRRILNEESLTG